MDLTAEQKSDIEALRGQSTKTRRACAPHLEEILYEPFPVLDHGFVRVIDYMGDDAAVVQAARVSYGKGTKKVQSDAGLINYLLRHRHTTPFEMCEIKFHIKMPIFVARQWIRHRTANVNEYSARYSIMDKEFYIPSASQLATQSEINHQGRGDVLEGDEAAEVLAILKEDAETCYSHYEHMINEGKDGSKIDESRQGLARELARMNLTINTYTQWYWKIDLHNFMHFLSLRADSHAQYEIRVYAEVMLDMLKKWMPATHDAFTQYRIGGTHLSAKGMDIVRRLLAGEEVTQEQSGMSAREYGELMDSLGKN